MEWLDISVPIRNGMTVFEGDPAVALERVEAISQGAICNLSRLQFGVHTGTHIDAPAHFIDGAPGADAIPLDALAGSVLVVDAGAVEGRLDETFVRSLAIPEGTERIIFKTRNSELWDREGFAADFVGLTEGAARCLVTLGIRLAGIDYLSIAPFGDAAPAHIALLEAGVVILEGLDLRQVKPGNYLLLALPLLIPGADGAPARALLGRGVSLAAD